MSPLKRYVLRLFISLKYITANVVDRSNGRMIATASTVEHPLKNSLECGRACNAKAAAVVGEVLAMRLRVEGLDKGIHVDIKKEIEKKGFKNQTKVWAIVNSLKNSGIKLILDDNDDKSSPPKLLSWRLLKAPKVIYRGTTFQGFDFTEGIWSNIELTFDFPETNVNVLSRN